MFRRGDPLCVRGMGVPGGDTQRGKFCLGIQFRHNFVTLSYRQFVGADRGKGFLCINIKGCNKLFCG